MLFLFCAQSKAGAPQDGRAAGRDAAQGMKQAGRVAETDVMRAVPRLALAFGGQKPSSLFTQAGYLFFAKFSHTTYVQVFICMI